MVGDNIGDYSPGLDDLNDVDLTGIADDYVLTYDSASGKWGPEASAGGIYWTQAAGDLSPTTATDTIKSTGGLTIVDSESNPLTIEDDTAAESATISRSLTDLIIDAGVGGGLALISTDDVTVKLGDAAGANYFQILDSGDAVIFQVDSNGVISNAGATAVIITSSTSITNTLGDNAGAQSFIVEDSDNADLFTINSDGDTDWILPADGYVKIDAGTTDHTGTDVFQIDLDVNSASVAAIALDIDVGTALSAAEVVTGLEIDIDGDAGDNAGSFLYGIYLTTAGTSSGSTFGIWFAGSSFTYQIGLDDDLNIGFDTNDGSTEFALYDSDDAKVFSVDSDGVIGGSGAGVEIETGTTDAVAALTLDQNDADEPFIEFEGTSAADQANNISTVNGDGSVEGPNNFSSSAGWAFEGMIRVGINGTDRWMPFYSEDTS